MPESHTKTCTCGETIAMRLLRGTETRSLAPITTKPSERGNIRVWPDQSYSVLTKDDTYDGPRFLNHFTDCPDAKRFGGRKAGNPSYREPEARQSGFDLGADPSRYTD